MRILFLNQYFPPDPAPTGILLKEVADALAASGHEILYASSGQDYRAGQKKGSRLRREMGALLAIFRAAMAAGPVDAIVSATSPPLLVLAAAAVAHLRRARHYHWLFDMYPELATALGEIPESPISRLFAALTAWSYRQAGAVVALDEDMAARLRTAGVHPEIIPPWVFQSLLDSLSAPSSFNSLARDPEPVEGVHPSSFPKWLYSGNLGRAHEWRALLDAQKLIEASGAPWRLVFQGGGPSWPAAQDYAASLGLAHCEWRPYVPEDQLPASLLAADVLIVTQRPETCGLLWPSKLALVTCLPRPILWVGPTDGAIARDLATLPNTGIFAPDDPKAIAAWLTNLSPKPVSSPRDPAATRAAALRQWLDLITPGA